MSECRTLSAPAGALSLPLAGFFPRRVPRTGSAGSMLLAATLAVMAPLAVGAQQTPPPAADAAVDPAVPAVTATVDVESTLPVDSSVATRLPLSLAWTPAAVSVVPAGLFNEQGGATVSDALLNVSGLNVQTQSGTTDFFLIRGFDSVSSGLVLTDGVAEPEASFYHLYNLDRVETLKGPAGFLYGGNPLAGAVSLVRKRPTAAATAVGATVRAGSFGSLGADFDLDLGKLGSDRLALRLNGLYAEADGYRDDKASESWAVNPVLTWRASDATDLKVDLEWVENDASPDAGIPFLGPYLGDALPDVPRERSYQSPYDASAQELGRARFDLTHQWGSSASLRAKTYYTSLDWQSNGTLFNGAFPTPDNRVVLARTLVLLDDRQEFFGQQLEGVFTFATGGIDHQLLVGVELAEQRDEFTFDVALLPVIDIYQPVETAAGPPFVLPGFGGAGDARSRIVAPYILDRMFLAANFEVVIGGRYDQVDYEDAVTGVASDDGHFSPILGAVWAPADGWSVYANLSEGFAPPSTLVLVDREFEESRGVEAGVKRSLAGGRLNLTLAGYQLERENIGIPDDNGVTQQAGDQRSRGIELELQASPGDGWTAFFSYAYTDAELVRFAERVLVSVAPPNYQTIDRSGNTAPFAPEHLANLWVSKRLDFGLGLAGGLRYVGEQFIDEDNAYAIDDVLTLDAAVSYRFAEHYEVRLNLRNLTDEETYQRGFGPASVIPADPRSVAGSLQVRF